MAIYTSAFTHPKSIKNQEKHTEHTGKQVVWVTVNKGREIKGIPHENWHSGRCISASKTHKLTLVIMDIFSKHFILDEWQETESTELPVANARRPTTYTEATGACDDPAAVVESCTLPGPMTLDWEIEKECQSRGVWLSGRILA